MIISALAAMCPRPPAPGLEASAYPRLRPRGAGHAPLRAAVLPAGTCVRVAPEAAQLLAGPGPRAILARAHEAILKIGYKIVNKLSGPR